MEKMSKKEHEKMMKKTGMDKKKKKMVKGKTKGKNPFKAAY